MLVNIPKIGNANLYGYKYDQLNRIKSMDAFTGINNADNSFTAVSGQSYKERVTYDANGNILTYKRNGDNARLSMDEMTYTYKPNTNQLDKVVDIAPDASLIDYNKYRDIKQGQQNGNYQYDAIGNLIADVSEGITNIKWNVYGKIQEINKNGSLINYTYDASGNRISKTADGKTTWYVRDASGNVMSVYTVDATVNSGHLTQSELNLYGSSRLGIWNANKDIAVTPNTNYIRGNKWFELSNHLGNVLATITDKRLPHTSNNSTIDYYEADISTASDYYLGGMEMKGRNYNVGNYAYGFNGKRKDNNMHGEGNTYDFGGRIYDPRVVIWYSIDPLYKKFEKYSPYSFCVGNPVAIIDYDGRDIIDFIKNIKQSKEYKVASGVWMKSQTFNNTLARFAGAHGNDDSKSLGYTSKGDLSGVKLEFMQIVRGQAGEEFQGKTTILAKTKDGKEIDLLGYTGNMSDITLGSLKVSVQFSAVTDFPQKLIVGNHELLVHAEKFGELVNNYQNGNISGEEFTKQWTTLTIDNLPHTEMANGFNSKYNTANAELQDVVTHEFGKVNAVDVSPGKNLQDALGTKGQEGITPAINKIGQATIQQRLDQEIKGEKSYFFKSSNGIKTYNTKDDMNKDIKKPTNSKS